MRNLEPAQHVVPPPADGWAAKDLSDDELVDDEFIERDSDSYVVKSEESDGS